MASDAEGTVNTMDLPDVTVSSSDGTTAETNGVAAYVEDQSTAPADESITRDEPCQPSASKKPRIEEESSKAEGAGGLDWEDGPIAVAKDTVHSIALEEATGRRRSTRAARRVSSAAAEDDHTVISQNEEDVDDPDFQLDDPEFLQLSDSDDDPDFAPSAKKESPTFSEFTYKPRGKGRGRGKSRGTSGRGRGRGGRGQNNNTPIIKKSNENSQDGESKAADKGSSPAVSQVKRRGRPLVYFNSNADTNKSAPSKSTVTSTVSTSLPDTSSKVSSSTVLSPSKVHSSIYYPPLKRQTQAVRLPEGPELTPEQLKEIEAQFKSGDFVIAKKDMELDTPPIWRIDGKSLLQKFQAFDKDGKTLYRNISTYSGWTAQGKTLYVPVKTKFIFQSRYDIVVELIDESVPSVVSGAAGEAAEPSGKNGSVTGASSGGLDKKDAPHGSTQDESLIIPEELNQHMATFEVFLQTLISQALDSNFLSEIYDENDEYFVDRVKIIEELTDTRKQKLQAITPWVTSFRCSLEVWPCINIMSNISNSTCEACSLQPATKLALFYGQPYDGITLKPREEAEKEAPTKNYNVCENCSRLSQTYNGLCHRKYDYYCKCKATVTNIRVSQPSKNTTTILRELLGNDAWITGLFRGMCTSFVRVDRLFDEHHQKLTGSTPVTLVKAENNVLNPQASSNTLASTS